jgi:hypothetical protein
MYSLLEQSTHTAIPLRETEQKGVRERDNAHNHNPKVAG